MRIVRAVLGFLGFFFLLCGVMLLWGTLPSLPSLTWINGYLLGSACVAYSVILFWIALSQAYGALVGCGLSGSVALGGGAIYLLRLSREWGDFMRMGEYALYLALVFLALFLLGLKMSWKKQERLAFSIQALFGLLCLIFLLEGIYLTIPLGGHFPWMIPDMWSVVYGWSLIGAALFFAWGVARPVWENGYPLLYGIVAYNLLIIGPLLSVLKDSRGMVLFPSYLFAAIILIVLSALWAIGEIVRHFMQKKRSLR